ncbi:unnamed protein product [Mytilus edulis]|uniref:B box-type domain-containing protein n=1 Tax=Mytilus edulis TaxID=6550 RepID=A0A8S3QV23_MYTED|nr:unnamed protein product [Mytilus edulis]
MASNWTFCGVCEYRHLTKPSVVWCSECDEGLCEECKEHHGFSKGTRSHGIASIADYQKLPYNVLKLASSCDKHKEKYVMFCKNHDCPCCKKCIVESHIQCKELIDIEDITRNIKSSNAFADVEQTLSEIAENIKRLRIDRDDNLALIGKKSKEIEKEVLETRSRINLHLDKLQDAILKDLKTREEEESNKIRRLLKSMTDKEKEIAELQTNIANIKQYASELQTFLALKHIEKDVVAEEKYIQSMVKSDGAKQVDFSCNINPSLQGLISAIQKFGDVVVTADPCKIPIQKHRNKQAQMVVAVKPMTIDRLAPTLLQTLYTELDIVTGFTLLPDRRMVLSCAENKLIRVFKQDGSLDFEIGNIGRVFDVVYIGDNKVAMTSGYSIDFLEINVIELETRKIKKTLKVNSVNSGVAYSEDKLIYCAGKNGIQMINLNNESIVNVTKNYVSVFSYVATFRDNIFYTDCNDDSVTCIDFQGTHDRCSKILVFFKTLQDALLREINTKEEEESNKIRRILKSLIDKEKEITENQTNIGNIKQYASELQTFLSLKHIETNVVVAEQYIQSIVKSDGANQIDFSCKINPSLRGLISAIQKFGDGVVTSDRRINKLR